MKQDKRATNIELYERDRRHIAYIKTRLSLSTQAAVIRYALEYLVTALRKQEENSTHE